MIGTYSVLVDVLRGSVLVIWLVPSEVGELVPEECVLVLTSKFVVLSGPVLTDTPGTIGTSDDPVSTVLVLSVIPIVVVPKSTTNQLFYI